MRWKLLLAFGAGFTVIFVVLAVIIVNRFTTEADSNLRQDLRAVGLGGAETIDADLIAPLLAELPTRESAASQIGEVYPPNAGYLAGKTVTEDTVGFPVNARYWDLVNQLVDIRRISPDSSPYIYVLDGSGQLAYLSSWAALGFPAASEGPPDGVPFLISASDVGVEAIPFLEEGLFGFVEQPGSYVDEFGEWISVYTPISDSSGEVVAGLGVDYYYDHVSRVRSQVITTLLVVFGITYVVLIGLIMYLSGWLTRRLSRLSGATQLVASGDYSVDVASTAHSRYPDEMTELAAAFEEMVSKVATRERNLVKQVEVLRVEIDETRRREAVAEIVDGDFFADLTAKADLLRSKVRGADVIAET